MVLLTRCGGIGIYENGSAWKISYEIFDFERQGESVAHPVGARDDRQR